MSMQLTHEIRGRYLLIKVKGRLDASWSDYFTDTLMNHIRKGHHHLVINASEMTFLSSAGIRSLLMVYKELKTVQGSFLIAESSDFVNKTLGMSGFQSWLAEKPPEDLPDSQIEGLADGPKNDLIDKLADTASPNSPGSCEIYRLNPSASFTLASHSAWMPWKKTSPASTLGISFPEEAFSLGIGSAAENYSMGHEHFGEFLAVAGNVVYQPPAEESRPDYLMAGKDYIPSMQCIQALVCRGKAATLIRFSPSGQTHFFRISELLDMILEQSGSEMAGFVILGEIEGLVGASLIQSPGFLSDDRKMSFPEIKEWLSFSGERVFPNQQALIAGVVKKREPDEESAPLLPPLPSRPDIAAHVHAAVFPYQPLQNGKIDLEESVRKFFSGPPPLAVMHLAEDLRPAVGIGQSALIRGACWCGPVKNQEVL